MSQLLEDDDSQSLPLEDVVPPSIRLNEPLIESYTYHSCEDTTEPDEYIMGVDEAGRGPVLGPQVYGVAFCKVSYEEPLKLLGFADSKTLTHEQRKNLLQTICSCPDDLKWAVRVMSPHDISRHMLQKAAYNLNAQSHDATTNLIRDVLRKGYNISKVYVDTVGPSAAYQAKLEAQFPTLSFVVESKADFKYPIVGAASIAAKVTRDACLSYWTFLEGSHATTEDRNFGSGYPSDPRTVAWLENNLDPVFGYTNIARFSWATVRSLMDKKGAKVAWADEPGSIQKYFSKSTAPPQAPLWKDLGLQSVAAF